MATWMSRKKLLVAGVLLAIFAGVAGAQLRAAPRTAFLTSGMFTIGETEVLKFHVVLDDEPTGPAAPTVLRVFDSEGNVVAKKQASLQPGQSMTLSFKKPGLYRVQAKFLEPVVDLERKRSTMATVELFNDAFPKLGAKTVCWQTRSWEDPLENKFN